MAITTQKGNIAEKTKKKFLTIQTNNQWNDTKKTNTIANLTKEINHY